MQFGFKNHTESQEGMRKGRTSSQKLLSRNLPTRFKNCRGSLPVPGSNNPDLGWKFIHKLPKTKASSTKIFHCKTSNVSCESRRGYKIIPIKRNIRKTKAADFLSKMTDPTYISPTLHKTIRYNPKTMLRKIQSPPSNAALKQQKVKIPQSNIKNSLPPSLRKEMRRVAKEHKFTEFVQYENIGFNNKGVWTKNAKKNKKDVTIDLSKTETLIHKEPSCFKTTKNITCFADEDILRETPSEQETTQKEPIRDSFEKKRNLVRKIQTQRSSRTGYTSKRSQVPSTQPQSPSDCKESKKVNLRNTFFPKPSKEKNHSKDPFKNNFIKVARKGLNTNLNEQGKAEQAQKNYSKSVPKFGNQDTLSKQTYSISELNSDYKSFLTCSELNLWDTYEAHWLSFSKTPSPSTLTASQIPFPPNNTTFILHMRRILERKGEGVQVRNTKEQWRKCVKEALRRYHPDKFRQNFGKLLDNEHEKEILMGRINSLCQVMGIMLACIQGKW
ncbi:unnamed protein product [Moneuplotes crassus]|uniref:Uncharacterized protein n=1 Tax=Euplotes crassus TaxID=5936 RepID=A0AAD1UB69_EUPCR|nr:unnamed protein product [Moneuplotes crassus]